MSPICDLIAEVEAWPAVRPKSYEAANALDHLAFDLAHFLGGDKRRVMRLLGSIDAVAELLEGLLPRKDGWRWVVSTGSANDDDGPVACVLNPRSSGQEFGAQAKTPATALFAAMLKAMQAGARPQEDRQIRNASMR